MQVLDSGPVPGAAGRGKGPRKACRKGRFAGGVKVIVHAAGAGAGLGRQPSSPKKRDKEEPEVCRLSREVIELHPLAEGLAPAAALSDLPLRPVPSRPSSLRRYSPQTFTPPATPERRNGGRDVVEQLEQAVAWNESTLDSGLNSFDVRSGVGDVVAALPSPPLCGSGRSSSTIRGATAGAGFKDTEELAEEAGVAASSGKGWLQPGAFLGPAYSLAPISRLSIGAWSAANRPGQTLSARLVLDSAFGGGGAVEWGTAAGECTWLMRIALADIAAFDLPATGLTHLTSKPTLRLTLAARPVFFLRPPVHAAPPAFQPLYPPSALWQAPGAQAQQRPTRRVEAETGDFTGGVASLCPWHEVEVASWNGLEEWVALLRGLGVAATGVKGSVEDGAS